MLSTLSRFLKYTGLPFATLVLVAGMGCLEPGSTPLGPQNSPASLPEDAVIITLSGPELGLVATRLDESRPLFETTVLFCGFDPASGFRAEPIFRFDAGGFEPVISGVEFAKLIPGFPDPSTEEPWLGDNPDLGRDIQVLVWRLPALGYGTEFLTRLAEIPGAYPITDTPTMLESGTSGVDLPPDSVAAWIAAGDTVNLAFEYLDALSEDGVIRLHSMRSDSTATVLQITPFSTNEAVQSREAVDDGLAAEKLDTGADFQERFFLATGVGRDAHLALNLPEDLRDSEVILVRAVLSFWPDSSGLFGMSPRDREDNDIGGLYLNEGGLTLELRAVDDSEPGSAGIEEGTVLESALALFEEHFTYEEGEGSSQLSATRLKEPFLLPLTRWVQDWMNGDDENHGISLRLRGEEERLRQVEWHLDPADPELAPKLEIIYVRRPDFD